MGKENGVGRKPAVLEQKTQTENSRRERFRDFEGGLNGYSLDHMLVYQKMLEKSEWRS